MAYGILETMEGKAGLRAWQMLFVIEGALTCFVAILALFSEFSLSFKRP
jgi:hypothetical protein